MYYTKIPLAYKTNFHLWRITVGILAINETAWGQGEKLWIEIQDQSLPLFN